MIWLLSYQEHARCWCSAEHLVLCTNNFIHKTRTLMFNPKIDI